MTALALCILLPHATQNMCQKSIRTKYRNKIIFFFSLKVCINVNSIWWFCAAVCCTFHIPHFDHRFVRRHRQRAFFVFVTLFFLFICCCSAMEFQKYYVLINYFRIIIPMKLGVFVPDHDFDEWSNCVFFSVDIPKWQRHSMFCISLIELKFIR